MEQNPHRIGSRRYHARHEFGSRIVGHRELLARVPGLTRELLQRADELFPVQVTRSFFERSQITGEANRLLAQVIPDSEELVRSPGDVDDPVGDKAVSPLPWVVQKHHDRVLLLVTKRCHLYCRFCFRRDHEPGEGMDPTPEELEEALRFCEGQPAREVILSGGDPLSLRTRDLIQIIDRLQRAGKRIRIHTRAPISAPEQISPELVEALSARRTIWVVVHANHVQEISKEVATGLRRFVEAGIPVLNQSVLLAGINDDVDSLVGLCCRLAELGVKPYYLHLTDPVPGNARFRVDPVVAVALHAELSKRVGGIELPRLVVDLPDGSGKMDVSLALAKGLVG